MMMFFWVATPCELIGGYQDGDRRFLQNIVATCKSTWHQNPEEELHCCEDFKLHNRLETTILILYVLKEWLSCIFSKGVIIR
jgi:hypothetical protein